MADQIKKSEGVADNWVGLKFLRPHDVGQETSFDDIPNNKRLLKLLDSLAALVEEIKAAYKKNTHKVNIPHLVQSNNAIQKVHPAQQSAESSTGNPAYISEVPLEEKVANGMCQDDWFEVADGEIPDQKEAGDGAVADKWLGSSFAKPERMSMNDSNIKLRWDILELLFIGFEIIILPVRCFPDPNPESRTHNILNIFSAVSLVCWFVDLFEHFRRFYYIGHGDVDKHKLVTAQDCFKIWFAMNIICFFSDMFNFFMQNTESTLGFVRIVKIWNFFRVIRTFKIDDWIITGVNHICSKFVVVSIRIIHMFFFFFLICHCFWWVVGIYNAEAKLTVTNFAYQSITVWDRRFNHQLSFYFQWALLQFFTPNFIHTKLAGFSKLCMCVSLAVIGVGFTIVGMNFMRVLAKRRQDCWDVLQTRVQDHIPSRLCAKVLSYVRASKRSVSAALEGGGFQSFRSSGTINDGVGSIVSEETTITFKEDTKENEGEAEVVVLERANTEAAALPAREKAENKAAAKKADEEKAISEAVARKAAEKKAAAEKAAEEAAEAIEADDKVAAEEAAALAALARAEAKAAAKKLAGEKATAEAAEAARKKNIGRRESSQGGSRESSCRSSCKKNRRREGGCRSQSEKGSRGESNRRSCCKKGNDT
mmetsp:Transcript_153061/g.271487  ORF Transcript_153061/g.271487 Transcript_153061/m.271487 type:complete len:650 (+) Transcript_153061:47-1996(+)